jgi:hypothetical protein
MSPTTHRETTASQHPLYQTPIYIKTQLSCGLCGIRFNYLSCPIFDWTVLLVRDGGQLILYFFYCIFPKRKRITQDSHASDMVGAGTLNRIIPDDQKTSDAGPKIGVKGFVFCHWDERKKKKSAKNQSWTTTGNYIKRINDQNGGILKFLYIGLSLSLFLSLSLPPCNQQSLV